MILTARVGIFHPKFPSRFRRTAEMVKLIALYKRPENTTAFDEHYFKTHIPLVQKVPGLRKVEVTRVSGAPFGESPYHLMAEMYFDSEDAMNAANASTEGKAMTRDFMSFAAKYATLIIGEVND